MNDIKQQNCAFGESIVSYLYDEMRAADRECFEDHLLTCTDCTDEFAAIADVRYGVYEWNKIEFVPMETPQITIPYEEPDSAVSFVDKVRHATRFNWGWTSAAAFASLLIASSVGYFAFIGGAENEKNLANLRNDENRSPVLQTPTVSDSAAKGSLPVLVNNDHTTEDPVPPTVRTNAIQTKAVRTNAKRNVAPQSVKFAEMNARKPAAPRLSDVSDDEDQTLRLADILDVLDSSE
jgi:hypothetical protein